MTKSLIIAEKPSVAQDIVRALTPSSGKFETVYTDKKTTVLRIRSAAEIKKIESEQPQSSDDTDDSGTE